MNANNFLQRAAEMDPDNPPWTKEQLARARPAREVLSKEELEAWEEMRLRAAEEDERDNRRWVTFQMEADVFTHFLQPPLEFDARVNAILREAMERELASPIAEPRGEAA